jgi:heterodisulfide reductase subunit B
LKHIHHEVVKDSKLAGRLKALVGKEYQGKVISKHILDYIKDDIGLDRLKSMLRVPLNGLKVVSYYGCLTRLPGVDIDDVENPVIMDEIVGALGAEPLEWSHKTECCGASLSVTRTEIALRLVKSILEAAMDRGAECIAVVCPLCQSNLDTRQADINKKYGTSFSIPVLYLSQLMGLAQKLNSSQLGLDRLIISPKDILLAKGINPK